MPSLFKAAPIILATVILSIVWDDEYIPDETIAGYVIGMREREGIPTAPFTIQ